jgi:hypothetical protein
VQVSDAFGSEYGLKPAVALSWTLLIVAGWLLMVRRNRIRALVVIAPVFVTMAAAGVHQYPFARRLVLFLLPYALLGLGAAADGLGAVGARWQSRARTLIVVVVLLPGLAALVQRRPVVHVDDGRPAWEFIASTRAPGEPVYVYFTGWLAAGYYAPRFGIPDRDVHYGRCHAGDPAGYRAELAAWAGTGRLWLFFTHASWQERVDILAWLDSTSTRLDSLVIQRQPRGREPGASAYRYDLSAMPAARDSMRVLSQDSLCRPPGPHLPVDSALTGWGHS